MNESLYLIWCPLTGIEPRRYNNIDSARAEARRLCQLPENSSGEYYVLRAVESVQYRTDPFVCRVYCKG